MRYVVTGAAGFIGSLLAEALLEEGHDVVGVDAFTDSYDPVRKRENAARIDVLEGDLLELDLDALFEGAAGVFHLAGQPGVRGSFGPEFELYTRRNLLVSGAVFEAAARAGARVVFALEPSVYGDAEAYPTPEEALPRPISPYGVTKLACEHLGSALAATLGLDLVALRYFTVYGPRQRPDMAFTRMLEALATGGTWRLFGDGTQARSFTYVDDVVTATIAAMERGTAGRAYNVGGGEEATVNEAIALAERVSGRTLRVERVDVAMGDVRRTRADVSRAADELGWAPVTLLEAGLAAQWEWAAARVATA